MVPPISCSAASDKIWTVHGSCLGKVHRNKHERLFPRLRSLSYIHQTFHIMLLSSCRKIYRVLFGLDIVMVSRVPFVIPTSLIRFNLFCNAHDMQGAQWPGPFFEPFFAASAAPKLPVFRGACMRELMNRSYSTPRSNNIVRVMPAVTMWARTFLRACGTCHIAS